MGFSPAAFSEVSSRSSSRFSTLALWGFCASNSNNVLTDFLRTGIYDRNRPFHTTISPSMDLSLIHISTIP